MTTPAKSDLDRLAQAMLARVGPPPWSAPDGYPESMALCILDSIWSIGVRYQSVENVVDRYRHLRSELGGNADRDSASDLLATIERCGGPDAFADAVQNHQRTSSTSGILKADAVHREAEIARSSGADTVSQLRALSEGAIASLKAQWCSVPGQRSGISFTYFTMLAGVPDVKADRMICSFVSKALGRTVAREEARSLLTLLQAHEFPSESLVAMDHTIWRVERQR